MEVVGTIRSRSADGFHQLFLPTGRELVDICRVTFGNG